MKDQLFARLQEISLNALRIISGFLLMPHGLQKVFGMFGGFGPEGGAVPVFSQLWIGGLLEVIGGLAIVLGLVTRPVAFVLSGMMAVAFFQFHFIPREGIIPFQVGGEAAVLYCFIFLYLFASGGGAFSLDGLMKKRKAG